MLVMLAAPGMYITEFSIIIIYTDGKAKWYYILKLKSQSYMILTIALTLIALYFHDRHRHNIVFGSFNL